MKPWQNVSSSDLFTFAHFDNAVCWNELFQFKSQKRPITLKPNVLLEATNYYLHQKGHIFSLVCLSVSEITGKTILARCSRNVSVEVEAWARAKEEPIQCWSGSKWLNTRYWKIWEKRYNCNIASSITVLYFSTCKFKFDSRKNGVLCCCRHGGTGVLHFVVNFNSVFLYFSTAAQCETKWIYMQVLAQSSMWSIHVWVHLKKCSTTSTSSIYCT